MWDTLKIGGMGAIRLRAIRQLRQSGDWPDLIGLTSVDLAIRKRGVGAWAGPICGAWYGHSARMHIGYVHLLAILLVWLLPESELMAVSSCLDMLVTQAYFVLILVPVILGSLRKFLCMFNLPFKLDSTELLGFHHGTSRLNSFI